MYQRGASGRGSRDAVTLRPHWRSNISHVPVVAAFLHTIQASQRCYWCEAALSLHFAVFLIQTMTRQRFFFPSHLQLFFLYILFFRCEPEAVGFQAAPTHWLPCIPGLESCIGKSVVQFTCRSEYPNLHTHPGPSDACVTSPVKGTDGRLLPGPWTHSNDSFLLSRFFLPHLTFRGAAPGNVGWQEKFPLKFIVAKSARPPGWLWPFTMVSAFWLIIWADLQPPRQASPVKRGGGARRVSPPCRLIVPLCLPGPWRWNNTAPSFSKRTLLTLLTAASTTLPQLGTFSRAKIFFFLSQEICFTFRNLVSCESQNEPRS